MIPQLRFPEFEGEWLKVKLKNVSTYFNGGSFESDVQQEGKYELVTLKSINMSGKLVHSKRYINIEVPTLSNDTLVMILSEQAPGLVGMTALIPIDNKYVLNQRVAEIRPNDKVESYFLSMAINRNQRYFSKHSAGTKVQNISKPNVENYEFLCPSLPEQTKIANFLTAVDKRINLLQKKKAELTQYKKVVMQKIFSQEIRFKQDDGSDFPDWVEKKLGDLGNTYNGLTGKTKVDFGKGKPYIQYMQIFSSSKIDTTNFGLVNIEEDENQNSAQYGDVFFTTSSETPNEIGTSSVLTEQVEEVYLNSFCFGYRPKSLDELVPEFSQFFFRSDKVRKEIIKLAQGSTRFNMSKVELMKLKFDFPKKEEQQKIANFLSSIDKSIEKLDNQIEQSQEWKQGLLQKMFV